MQSVEIVSAGILIFCGLCYLFAIKLNNDTGGWDWAGVVMFILAPGSVPYAVVAGFIDWLRERSGGE